MQASNTIRDHRALSLNNNAIKCTLFLPPPLLIHWQQHHLRDPIVLWSSTGADDEAAACSSQGQEIKTHYSGWPDDDDEEFKPKIPFLPLMLLAVTLFTSASNWSSEEAMSSRKVYLPQKDLSLFSPGSASGLGRQYCKVIRDGKGRRKKIHKASKVDVSRGLSCDSTETALTLFKTKGSLLLLERWIQRIWKECAHEIRWKILCGSSSRSTCFYYLSDSLANPDENSGRFM